MEPTFNNGDEEHHKKAKQYLASRESDMEFYHKYGNDDEAFKWYFKDAMRIDYSTAVDFYKKYPKTFHLAMKREFSWLDKEEIAEVKSVIQTHYSIGDFYEYGLAFDFVEAGTFGKEQNRGYYRFQLSWGGPSDEFRFYHNGSIEYVYLDWFKGIGFSVTTKEYAKWLKEQFEEVQSINWDSLESDQIELFEDEEE